MSAVFFHPTHYGRPMNVHAITLPDQRSQLGGIHIWILLLLVESKLEHLALEFDRALAAPLSRNEGNEPQLYERLLNLIEAFPTETELSACLRDGIPFDRMGAQHLVLDLTAIPRIEEVHLEEFRSDIFRMRVQCTGSQQSLLFGGSRHRDTNNTTSLICQSRSAHIRS